MLIEEDLVDITTLSPEEAEKVRHVKRSHKNFKKKKFFFTNNQIDNLLGLLAVSGVLLGGALYSLIDRYGFDAVVTSFFELVSVRLDFSEIVTKLKPFCEVMGWQEYFDNYFNDRLNLSQADYVGEQIREFSGGRYLEPINNQVNAELIHNLPTQPLRHDPVQVNIDPIEVLHVNTELISVSIEPIEIIQLNIEPIQVNADLIHNLPTEPLQPDLVYCEFDNHEAHKIKLQKQVSSSEWCTTIKKFTN